MPRHAAAFTTKGGAPKGSSLKYLGRLEVVVRNVLSGEDNALRQKHDAVVLSRGLLTGDQSIVSKNFNRADFRNVDLVADLHGVASGDVSSQIAAHGALDARNPTDPNGCRCRSRGKRSCRTGCRSR